MEQIKFQIDVEE